MSESLGFSVRIFMPSGQPEGLRIIEKSNWMGQGLVFPPFDLSPRFVVGKNSIALVYMSSGDPAIRGNCRVPM